MFDKKKRDAFYKLFFSKENMDFSLVEFLNDSSCDEIFDINLNDNTFKKVSHREGKYFVPILHSSSYKELYDFTLEYILHPDDKKIYEEFMNPNTMLERLEQSKLPHFMYEEYRYKLQSGEYRYVEQCIVTGEENGFKKGEIRSYIFDAQNRNKRNETYRSVDDTSNSESRDHITGLLNSKSFFEEARIVIPTNPDVEWCVANIDVTKFRIFNQWFGESTSNELLKRIGQILLEENAQSHGVSGYFGLDNFSILLPSGQARLEKLLGKIKTAITAVSNSNAFLPAIGAANVDKDGDVIAAFDRANVAVSQAKADITKPIYIYSPEMQSGFEQEIQILTDFMKALKKDEITFFLQPQCRISSRAIVGAEALARWIKPSGEIVSPGVFVPLLEKHGFIIDLDKYLWDKICAWLHNATKKGLNLVPISINISRADIFSIDVVDYFVSLCKKYDIPPRLIKLEITESAYAETTSVVAELVEKLRKKGFMVLMDDFGSGYSSLNMLSTLEVDAIKLDAMFLKMDDDSLSKGIHILESVINMAKIISVPIVVEGVENKKQCDFLEGLGCRYIQGYYFYKPMPIDSFEQLVSDPSKIDLRGFVVKKNEQLRIREFLDKNIYSDNMLNNIIGPVAFYSLKDGHVDIERFNEQFYEILGMPDMNERLTSIEQYLIEGEKAYFLSLYDQAVEDKLNGSVGFLRFATPRGSIIYLHLRLYYLGEKEGKKRFYGSVDNATELMEAKEQLSLISNFSSETILFIRQFNQNWSFLVASYALNEQLQITKEEFQQILDNNQMYRLFASRTYFDSLYKKTAAMIRENQTFTLSLNLLSKYREIVRVNARFIPVPDQSKNIKYILQLLTHY